MKTTSWDEIVFRDRNKNYGAYYLRRKYNKSVILSFIAALFIVSGLVGVPLVQAMMNKHNVGELDNNVIATVDNLRNPDDFPPPPPPPPAPINQIQKLIYVSPRVVDTVNLNMALVPTEEILGYEINQPVPDKLDVNNGKSEEIQEEVEKAYIMPQEYATFMGGDLSVFHAWVEKNIVYPQVAMENGIFGKVIVQFVINAKGELVDIKFLRSIDKSIDEETIRVLKLSPKWTPAKQGGTPVKQLFSMPVSFVLK
jgi:protein TonB